MIYIHLKEIIDGLEKMDLQSFPESVGIGSWRGVYSELAIGDYSGDQASNTKELKDLLSGAIGKTFEGYKGGDYKMSEWTDLWIADYGNCSPGECAKWLAPILTEAYFLGKDAS